MRTVTSGAPLEVRAWAGDQELGVLRFGAEPGWQEVSLPLPEGLPAKEELKLQAAQSWWLDAHVWVVSPQATSP